MILDFKRPNGKRGVVGAARFELTTSCSQSKRSTRLSYAPRRGERKMSFFEQGASNSFNAFDLSQK
jgi:hypothetical protein